MLRRLRERREFVAAERDERHAAARHRARARLPADHRLRSSGRPATATQGGRRSAISGTAGLPRGGRGIRRHDGRRKDAWRRSAHRCARRRDNRQDPRRRRSRRVRTGTGCAHRRGGAAGERQRDVEVRPRRPGARPASRASVVPPRMRMRAMPLTVDPLSDATRRTLPHRRAGCPSSASARTASRA